MRKLSPEKPDLLVFERQHIARGCLRLAGIDEAGRGPLAGPVVAAAVAFEASFIRDGIPSDLLGLTDSKRLTARKRDYYFQVLKELDAVAIGVGVASVVEIDRFNILQATHVAMGRALENLSILPDHVLIDGLPVAGLPVSSSAIVKGDSRSFAIASASVIAKVTRDRSMEQLDVRYPAYGFSIHKGYGTAFHLERLFEHGPCPEHRCTFRPVQKAMAMRDNPACGENLLC